MASAKKSTKPARRPLTAEPPAEHTQSPRTLRDPWAEEEEREALSRRYGHLDLDRGTFDAFTAPEMDMGAKVAIGAASAAALGALAWLVLSEPRKAA